MKKISLLLGIIFVSSTLIGCGGGGSSSSDKHVKMGMTKIEVMKLLGDPNVTKTDEGKWYYFDSKFTKKYNRMNKYLESDNEADIIRAGEIYNELLQMHFTCRFIRFYNDQAVEYLFDKNHRYDESKDYYCWEPKTQSSLAIKDFNSVDCYRSGQTFVPVSDDSFEYEARYSDKSVYRSIVTPSMMTISEGQSNTFVGSWKVEGFDSFTSVISINAYDGYVNVQYNNKRNGVSGIGLYNSGDQVNLVATLKNGYQHDGWYDSSFERINNELSYSFVFSGTGRQSYIFLADPIEYSITYNLDGGNNSYSNPNTYNIESNSTLYSASKTGYIFVGWFDGAGNKIETITSGKTGEIVLNARWEVITYKAIFEDEDGHQLYETTYTYFDEVPEYQGAPLTKDSDEDFDYQHVGWKLDRTENDKEYYRPVFDRKSVCVFPGSDGSVDIIDHRDKVDESLIRKDIYIPSVWDGVEIELLDYLEIPNNKLPIIESIHLGKNMRYFGRRDKYINVFRYMPNLSEITVDPGNPYIRIDQSTLITKDGDTIISFPRGIECESFGIHSYNTSIAEDAFYYNKIKRFYSTGQNENFKVYEGVVYDKEMNYILVFPKAMEGTFVLPDGCNFWYSEDDCRDACYLTSIDIGSYKGILSGAAFIGCISLENFITDPDNDTFGVLNRSLVHLPTNYDNYYSLICCPAALEGEYIISSEIEVIRYYAFNQSKLTSITIPTSVTEITDSAFSNCLQLQTIIYQGTVEQWNSIRKSETQQWCVSCPNVSKVQCSNGAVELINGNK